MYNSNKISTLHFRLAANLQQITGSLSYPVNQSLAIQKDMFGSIITNQNTQIGSNNCETIPSAQTNTNGNVPQLPKDTTIFLDPEPSAAKKKLSVSPLYIVKENENGWVASKKINQNSVPKSITAVGKLYIFYFNDDRNIIYVINNF